MSLAPDEYVVPGHRPARGSLIRRSEEVVGFAPARAPYVCQDRAGRWRCAHEWDRDSRCVFCDTRMLVTA